MKIDANNYQVKEIIEQIADEIGGTVYEGYSGRGMFGKTCYGVTCDYDTEAIEVAARLGLKGAKIDNMGRRYIVYWPDPEIVEAVQEKEECNFNY